MRILILIKYSFLMCLAKLQNDEEKFWEHVIALAQKQGGLYIKFMQVLAMQAGIFSSQNAKSLLALYDNVGYEEIDIVTFAEKELGEMLSEFYSIEPTPFASGTFAQVYKAQLQTGETVIIKIKKPGLRRKLFLDFAILGAFLNVLKSLYTIQLLDIDKVYRRFKKNTFRELDYKSEVKNAIHFYNCYQSSNNVKIPKTYKHLCTKNLIVQEFISGLPLSKLIDTKSKNVDEYYSLLREYQIDVYMLLRTIGYELSVQGAKYEKFYGDPHPGNVILLGGNRFAFIDFGILDDVRVDLKNMHFIISAIVNFGSQPNLNDFAREMLKFGAPDLYSALKTLDQSFLLSNDASLTGLISSNYSKAIEEKALEFMTKKEEVGGVTQIFYNIVRLGNKYNLKVPDMLFNMMRSSAIFGSYARYLMPEVDVMPGVYHEMLGEFKNTLTDNGYTYDKFSTEAALAFLEDWATGLAEKDIVLYHKIRSSSSL